MGWLIKKSMGDVKLDQAAKDAKVQPDGSLLLVRTYHSAMGLRHETERMLGAGWALESQVPAGKKVVATWRRDAVA